MSEQSSLLLDWFNKPDVQLRLTQPRPDEFIPFDKLYETCYAEIWQLFREVVEREGFDSVLAFVSEATEGLVIDTHATFTRAMVAVALSVLTAEKEAENEPCNI